MHDQNDDDKEERRNGIENYQNLDDVFFLILRKKT